MYLYLKAKELRKNATMAERIVWKYLSNRQLANYKFRSQAVIENLYIADFYCPAKKLIIEIDGGIHNLEAVKEYDKLRTLNLEGIKYHVVRFSNDEVFSKIDHVLIKILRILESIE